MRTHHCRRCLPTSFHGNPISAGELVWLTVISRLFTAAMLTQYARETTDCLIQLRRVSVHALVQNRSRSALTLVPPRPSLIHLQICDIRRLGNITSGRWHREYHRLTTLKKEQCRSNADDAMVITYLHRKMTTPIMLYAIPPTYPVPSSTLGSARPTAFGQHLLPPQRESNCG